jgi:hypothetical protein
MSKPTQARLREVFDYDPESGVLTWRLTLSNRALVGAPVGYLTPRGDGYPRLRLDGQMFLSHRVIWCWMTGEWPKLVVDHINGVRSDNRWANLREAHRQPLPVRSLQAPVQSYLRV